MTTTGRFHRDDRGSAAANAAVVPAVLTLFVVVLQLGMWFHARVVTTAAAQHALEAARVDGGDNTAGAEAAFEFVDQVGGVDVDSLWEVDFVRENGTVTAVVHTRAYVITSFLPVPDIDVTLAGPEEGLVP